MLGALIILGTIIFSAAYYKDATEAYKTYIPHTTTITLDPGGILGEFLQNYSEARERGDHYVIDGLCISACTLITGEIPNDRVCITPYAKLAFHSAATIDPFGGRTFSKEGSELLWLIYPDNVKEMLKAHGWQSPDDEHLQLLWIDGKELSSIYKPCPPRRWFRWMVGQ
jgi:hypothetical protein